MKEIKPFLIAAIVALVLSQIFTFASSWIPIFAGVDPNIEVAKYTALSAIGNTLSWLVLNLVIAIWNLKEAKKEKTNHWLWFFLSLFLGVLGLVLFYSYRTYIKYSENKTDANQSVLTTPEAAPPTS